MSISNEIEIRAFLYIQIFYPSDSQSVDSDANIVKFLLCSLCSKSCVESCMSNLKMNIEVICDFPFMCPPRSQMNPYQVG